MRDKAGVSANDRNTLVSSIFGAHGMTSADSVVIYEERQEHTHELIRELAPDFMDYYERRVLPLLTENIHTVWKNDHVEPNWTNNNCESMNNVLKMAVNWTPQNIPTLIDSLHKVVEGLYADMERALFGEGKYRLEPEYVKYTVQHAVWRVTSAERRK